MKYTENVIIGVGPVTILAGSIGNSVEQGITSTVRRKVREGIENAFISKFSPEPQKTIQDWDEIELILDRTLEEYSEQYPARYRQLADHIGYDGIKQIVLTTLKAEAEVLSAAIGYTDTHANAYNEERQAFMERAQEERGERQKMEHAAWCEHATETKRKIAELFWIRRLGWAKVELELNISEGYILDYLDEEFGDIALDVVVRGDIKRVRSFVTNVKRRNGNGPYAIKQRMSLNMGRNESFNEIIFWNAMVERLEEDSAA